MTARYTQLQALEERLIREYNEAENLTDEQDAEALEEIAVVQVMMEAEMMKP